MMVTHFSRNEAACKCGCGFAAMDRELLEVLEDLRSFLDRPIIVTSWCRCEQYNRRVGGAPGSYHVKGMAADICPKDLDPDIAANYFETAYPGVYGIGRYDTWVHIDVRPQMGRWDKRSR